MVTKHSIVSGTRDITYISSLEQLRTRAQRNDHCRTSSLNKHNYCRLKPTGRLDRIVLHKTIGHRGSPQYRLNKSKKRLKTDLTTGKLAATINVCTTKHHDYCNWCPASNSTTCRSRRRAVITWLETWNARHCGASDVVNEASHNHNLAVAGRLTFFSSL